MRVLVVAFHLTDGPGGIRRYTSRLWRALTELEENQVRGIALWEKESPDGRIRACAGSKASLLRAFTHELRARQPDVILYAHLLFAPLGLFAARLAPSSQQQVFVYGVDAWDPPRRLRATAVARLDGVISISRFTAHRMHAVYDRLPSFSFVPPAHDTPEVVAPVPLPGDPAVLAVSRMDHHDEPKGIGALLDAMPMVLRQAPATHLHIAGDGPLRHRFEMSARTLGINDRVTFHGSVDDSRLHALYGGTSIFALPSSKEGFGIVYLEAWSHGLPVVGGRWDAGAEVIQDGRTGLLADPSRPETIATALVRLAKDPACRLSMGQAGQLLVRSRYSHESFRAAIESALSIPAREAVAS